MRNYRIDRPHDSVFSRDLPTRQADAVPLSTDGGLPNWDFEEPNSEVSQDEVDRTVARATGESIGRIARMGFSLIDPRVELHRCIQHAAEPAGGLAVPGER